MQVLITEVDEESGKLIISEKRAWVRESASSRCFGNFVRWIHL